MLFIRLEPLQWGSSAFPSKLFGTLIFDHFYSKFQNLAILSKVNLQLVHQKQSHVVDLIAWIVEIMEGMDKVFKPTPKKRKKIGKVKLQESSLNKLVSWSKSRSHPSWRVELPFITMTWSYNSFVVLLLKNKFLMLWKKSKHLMLWTLIIKNNNYRVMILNTIKII